MSDRSSTHSLTAHIHMEDDGAGSDAGSGVAGRDNEGFNPEQPEPTGEEMADSEPAIAVNEENEFPAPPYEDAVADAVDATPYQYPETAETNEEIQDTPKDADEPSLDTPQNRGHLPDHLVTPIEDTDQDSIHVEEERISMKPSSENMTSIENAETSNGTSIPPPYVSETDVESSKKKVSSSEKWGGRYRMLQILGILFVAGIVVAVCVIIAVEANTSAKKPFPVGSTAMPSPTPGGPGLPERLRQAKSKLTAQLKEAGMSTAMADMTKPLAQMVIALQCASDGQWYESGDESKLLVEKMKTKFVYELTRDMPDGKELAMYLLAMRATCQEESLQDFWHLDPLHKVVSVMKKINDGGNWTDDNIQAFSWAALALCKINKTLIPENATQNLMMSMGQGSTPQLKMETRFPMMMAMHCLGNPPPPNVTTTLMELDASISVMPATQDKALRIAAFLQVLKIHDIPPKITLQTKMREMLVELIESGNVTHTRVSAMVLPALVDKELTDIECDD